LLSQSSGHGWAFPSQAQRTITDTINAIDWSILTSALADVVVPRLDAHVATLQAFIQRAQVAYQNCIHQARLTMPVGEKAHVGYGALKPSGQSFSSGFGVVENFPRQWVLGARPEAYVYVSPSIALGSAHVTCQQWHSLSQPWKLSLVRGVLEARGFTSLNNSVRGQVVYDLVHKIDAYCTAQIARVTAPRWHPAGEPFSDAAPAGSPFLGAHSPKVPRMDLRVSDEEPEPTNPYIWPWR